ncbi:hypothetical protein BN136_3646 [Cronobacter universalis NCTC 9529]|nr:hypothetical protein BN136_3646 [Cronobacter universalis NCTC 9529]
MFIRLFYDLITPYDKRHDKQIPILSGDMFVLSINERLIQNSNFFMIF